MKWTLQMFALVAATALTSNGFAAAQYQQTGWVEVAEDSDDDDSDPDFVRKFFPFSLNDNVAEPVDDISMTTYLLNIIPLGGLWGPLLLLDDDKPKADSDILVSYLVPSGIALGICCAGNFIGSMTVFFTGIPCPLGCLLAAVPYFWLAPTASLNGWDRAYRFGDTSGSKKSQKKSKRKKKKAQKRSDQSDSGGGTDEDKEFGEPFGY